MNLDDLQRRWLAKRNKTYFHSHLKFVDDRIEFGAEVTLAERMETRGGFYRLFFDGGEDCALARLSAVYLRPFAQDRTIEVLNKAASDWAADEGAPAYIKLAHLGLHRLDQPDLADYRLLLADGLLEEGMEPGELIKALGLFAPDGFNKEDRVPKGNGRPSGQWTCSGTGNPAAFGPFFQYNLPHPFGGAPKWKVVNAVPSDAKEVKYSDGSKIPDPSSKTGTLLAPPFADFKAVYAAGQAIAANSIASQAVSIGEAVGHAGAYDFQRDASCTTFYRAYSNASNYAVGVYMAGAGYSRNATTDIARFFAQLMSSNAGSAVQADWTKQGWSDAASGHLK